MGKKTVVVFISRIFYSLIALSFVLGEGKKVYAEEKNDHNKLISIKGGIFSPAQDGRGTGVNYMVGYDKMFRNGLSLGFEIGYKKFNRDLTVEVTSADDITDEVEVTSIPALFVAKYHFLFSDVVKPYLGIGAGVSYNHFNYDKFDERADSEGFSLVEKQSNGFGLNIAGLAGIRFMIASRISMFLEGKYSYEWQELENIENDSHLDLGGFYGNAGIGIEF